jgi:general secretion pathway protein J
MSTFRLKNKNGIYPFGFTLLELLISMAIFSLLAAMAYSGLNNVLQVRERTEVRADQFKRLQLAFNLMQRDIEQIIDRSIRDGYGSAQPALVGGQFNEYLLELTRTGWRNPLQRARSNMQRVAYAVEENQLIRLSWKMLDRAAEDPPHKRVLLDNVEQLDFKYIAGGNEPSDTWPPASIGTAGTPVAMPAAVIVELDSKRYGKIQRVFRVPG